MTKSNMSLRQRLRLGAGQSAEAWQRPLSHMVRDHFDDLEEHVRAGFRYPQVLTEIEAVRLEQFSAELDRREKATNRKLSVDPTNKAALAQLQAIAGYRQKPPFQTINQRSFGEAMHIERGKRREAGTYHFSGPRIVLPGVRSAQLFVDFDDEIVILGEIDDRDSTLATIADAVPDLVANKHGLESPAARDELPESTAKTRPTQPWPRKKRHPANSETASSDKSVQLSDVSKPAQSHTTGSGTPTAPISDSTSMPSVPDPARDPALPATEAPGSTARTSSLSRRPSGPALLDFD